MKSTYQFNSAQELSSEIIEAIKTAFGDKPIQITIEQLDNRQSTGSKNQFNSKSEIAESVLDIIFQQLSKPNSTKK